MNGHHNALSPGHRLHRYQIDSVLGQNGVGITYLAHDSTLARQVTIREFVPSDLVTRTEDSAVYPLSDGQLDTFGWELNRFLGEARALAQLRHPGIVSVLAVFEANNTGCMVMEHESGTTLADALETGRLAVDEDTLRTLLMPLLEGLEQVHAAGIVHRDIKPASIMLRTPDDGGAPVPVLIGFGLALEAGPRTPTASPSAGYSPFEQHDASREHDQQGPWTDIYSLAATLYRAVTGKQPAEAMSRVDPAMRGEDMLEPASRLAAGRYSKGFLAAIDSGLALMPGDRPQSIAGWRAIFEGKAPATGLVHVGTDIRMAKPTSAPPRAGRDGASSTHRRLLPVVVVAGLAATVAAGVWWQRGGQMPSPMTTADEQATSAPADAEAGTGTANMGPADGGTAASATAAAAAPARDDARQQADAERQQAEQAAQQQAETARQQAEQAAQQQAETERQQAEQAAQQQAEAERQQAEQAAQQQAEAERQQAEQTARQQAEAARQQAEQTARQQAEAARQQAEQAAQARADAARMQRVATLLSEADTDIAALRLSSPAGRNALERLREVQKLDPGNADAARALGRIQASYLGLVDRAIAAGNIDKAESFATRIESIAADSEAALDARKRIATARDARAQ